MAILMVIQTRFGFGLSTHEHYFLSALINTNVILRLFFIIILKSVFYNHPTGKGCKEMVHGNKRARVIMEHISYRDTKEYC